MQPILALHDRLTDLYEYQVETALAILLLGRSPKGYDVWSRNYSR